MRNGANPFGFLFGDIQEHKGYYLRYERRELLVRYGTKRLDEILACPVSVKYTAR